MSQAQKSPFLLDMDDDDSSQDIQTLSTADEPLPIVTPALIEHLRDRREWQNRCPEPSWSPNQIQQNIGANAVIEYMETLLQQQMHGSPKELP